MLTDYNFDKKHVESPGNWLEKHAEYVFTRFDSDNTGMTHHKLYVLWEINVSTYYKKYDYIWENL